MVPPAEGLEAIYQAMVLGLRDYVGKNRFPGIVLGMSGGIDSALCAAVAADALGPDKVHCVMMPSRYTSRDSLDDAAEAAKLLGVELREIGIEPAVEAFGTMLADAFVGKSADITEENLQSRAPRHHAHGAVQQVRLDGAVDRQQIRDVGRLCHALRRYVRRLCRTEGYLQDHGLRAVALA